MHESDERVAKWFFLIAPFVLGNFWPWVRVANASDGMIAVIERFPWGWWGMGVYSFLCGLGTTLVVWWVLRKWA